MTEFPSTQRVEDDATVVTENEDLSSFWRLVTSVKQAWLNGSSRDLADYLRNNAELCSNRSLVIELAVDEYRHRQERGLPSDVGQFCEQFLSINSALHSSICRQLEVERYLDDHPEVRDANELIKWPKVGDHIASFRVLEEIGHGALAHVYLCSQSALGNRQVVVKVSRRGIQEGNTLGKLQHAHIMPVHSVEVQDEDGLTYLCTPFLGRSTLHEVLSTAFSSGIPQTADAIVQAANIWNRDDDQLGDGPRSVRPWQKWSYVAGVLHFGNTLADALAHAHHAGVIHSDLKPSNILLTPTGEAVLLDFNLATDEAVALDVRGGTLPYMAPEQISLILKGGHIGDSTCGEHSEVFSLGVVLYELLARQLPFCVEEGFSCDPDQLLRRQRKGPPSLARINRNVGHRLESIVRRCLAYEPSDRYPSMRELQVALARELTALPSCFRWLRRHRRRVAVFLITLGISATCIAWWLFTRPPYHLREYQRGLVHQSEGQLQAAVSSFERSASALPGFSDALFAMGRANLELGNVDEALEQFIRVARDHDHEPSMACVGYCYNLKMEYALAIPWYEKALDGGYETAGIHNNLAVSYEVDRPEMSTLERMRLAELHLERALMLSPSAQSARFNRAHLEVLRLSTESSHSLENGLHHLTFLLEEGINSPNLVAPMLLLNAPLAKEDPTIAENVIVQCIDACYRNVGIDIDTIYNNPNLQVFREHPRFSELELAAKMQVNEAARANIPRIVDPVD